MATKTVAYDSAEFLQTDEAIAAYLEAAFEDGDPALIQRTIGTVARASGMTELARKIGMSRTSLYKALSPEGHPEFETVIEVLRALGHRLTVAPMRDDREPDASGAARKKREPADAG